MEHRGPRRTRAVLIAVALGCTYGKVAPFDPALDAVEPATAVAGVSVPVRLHGSFRPVVVVDLGGKGAVSEQVSARVGDALIADAVLRADDLIEGTLPDTLAPGAYPVSVALGDRQAAGTATISVLAPINVALQAPADLASGEARQFSLQITSRAPVGVQIALDAASVAPAGVAGVSGLSLPASVGSQPVTATGILSSLRPAATAAATLLLGVRWTLAKVTGVVSASANLRAFGPPGQLVLSSAATPARISAGLQQATLTLTASNPGGADVTLAALPAPGAITTLSAAVSVATQPASAGTVLHSGQSQSFVWTFNASGSGTVSWSSSASATEANTGATLSPAAVNSNSVAVDAPAALSLSLAATPARVSAGLQRVQVTLTATNTGGASFQFDNLLAPSALATGTAAASLAISPAPAGGTLLAGGATRSFTWSYDVSGSGTLTFSASASGIDANGGTAVHPPAATAAALVQTPAQLAISSVRAPAKVSRGQTFSLDVTLANAGQADALAALPRLIATGVTIASAPLPATVPGGGSVRFSFSLVESGTAPGTLLIAISAAGTDANSGAQAIAQQDSAAILVQAPAQLVIDSIALQPRISRGQSLSYGVVVRNAGGATAHAVTLTSSAAVTGGAAWTAGAMPAAFDLAGGVSATVTLSGAETGSADGTLAFVIGVAGSDANSGAALSAQAQTPASTVQQPASLQGALSAPTSVNIGQGFVVTLRITNGGEARAAAVQPAAPVVSSAAGVQLSLTGSPPATDIAGGTSATFAWTATSSGTATGTASIAVAASGSDANSGAALVASGSAVVAVNPPSSLTVSSFTVPQAVSRGQTFSAVLVVHNGGGATALNVTPALAATVLSGGAAATVSGSNPPVSLLPGANATFSWQLTENGTSQGALRLDASASGTDQNTNQPVSASSSAAVQVLEPAHLSVISLTAPSTIDRGQAFTATALVRNTGGATAHAVTPSLGATGSTGAAASVGAAPAAVDIAGGASASFAFALTENGTAPGSLTLGFSAAGTDVNSGAVTSATGGASVTVQSAAALSGSWSVPASAGLGATFTAVLTVNNIGGATASSVSPVASVSGTGSGTIASGPVPAGANIAGGANATFTYTLTATATGSVQISATVSGADANNGAPVSASIVSALIAIGEATTLSTNPFGGDGTTFSYLFSYEGQVYLGPNKTGTGAVRMSPDGSNPTPVNWQLEVQYGLNGARNTAYNNKGPTGVLCYTIGYPGCTQDTVQCGPDDEIGHGIFISGFTGATEWYVLTGASNIGGVHFFYMTNPAFPLATGGYDDLAWVQVQAAQFGSTRMASAGHFFNGSLYAGFLDSSGSGPPQPNAPVLNVLNRMPARPGYAASLGTDIVNLQAVNMPNVGAAGSPANPNTKWLMIDTISDFNGFLYLGNNGGLVRSTIANPGPCSGACSDWANTTPSSSDWAAKTSVVVDGSALGTLEPYQRAIPGIVPFGGRLFAARNTTTGPQLWACTPSIGGDPLQCEPGEWSLFVPNTVGDLKLTQLNNGSNTAITLLAATSAHLYVGYNDAGGIQIWRTASATASSISDFSGRTGCTAGASGCQGVGGNGLGNGSTRIFDSKVLNFSGQDWAYVSAGTGSTAPVVSRIVP